MPQCKSVHCENLTTESDNFCSACNAQTNQDKTDAQDANASLAERYPQYYKDVNDLSFVDVYEVHRLFDIQDPSGCLQHASKKILLAGVRTGSKSVHKDIKEARDTLTRWLQLNPLVNA